MGENLIYTKIADVMAEIGAIGKNSKNETQKFMYRGIDAVMNALNPALIKHRIFVIPEVMEQTREERTNSKGTTLLYSILKVKYRFIAEDGSSIECVVIGEGMDSGDKASNKAMSVAFKYACFQTFCIPTEEMVDPDSESHEVAPKELPKVEAAHIAVLMGELKRLGTPLSWLLKTYEVKSIEDFTMDKFMDAKERLSQIPTPKKE